MNFRPSLAAPRSCRLISLVVGAALALSAGVGQTASLPDLVTPETHAAIGRGLEFLAAHQREGSWSSKSGEVHAGGTDTHRVFHTGLCGMALLASGSTPHEGPYSEQIMKATAFLVSCCSDDGFIAIPSDKGMLAQPMYGHGFAVFFLSQVYGMTHDPALEAKLSNVLTRAVAFTAKYQSKNGGWHYWPTTEMDEGSVAISQMHGLRACQNAGIPVPKTTIDRFIAYLESIAMEDGGLAYRPEDKRDGSLLAVSAAGMATFFFAGANDHPLAVKLRRYVLAKISTNSIGGGMVGHEEYVRFCTGLGIFLWKDEEWPKFYRNMRDTLLPKQKANGSWVVVSNSMGDIYTTGMNLIVLQLPYKRVPILQQ